MRDRDAFVLNAVAGKRPNSKGWARGNCPFCELKTGKPDRKQCLGLRVDVGRWHCFRCGSGGYIGLADLPDDLASVRRRCIVIDGAEPEKRGMEPLDGFVPLFDGSDRSFAGDFMREYLTATGRLPDGERARGLPRETCAAASIGTVFDRCGRDHRAEDEPPCNRCRAAGRIVVPIFDVDGEVWLGWSGRALFKTARKYMYPSGMDRAHSLYNHAALHVETDRPVFVVEGVFDALWLWPDAVALLGKASPEQREALVAARRPVVVCLDGDATREAVALADRLRFEGQRAGVVRLAAGVDPDEVSRAELDRWAATALDA